jgi:hypothetical protein
MHLRIFDGPCAMTDKRLPQFGKITLVAGNVKLAAPEIAERSAQGQY